MIQTIAVVIAIFGAALLAVLAFASFANAAERKLARYRSKDEGLADLLNYGAMVDDGVIVGKNGSFMAAWIYKGDDNASSTDRQRDMVSFRINQALAGLGNGWMIHVDAPRRPAAAYSAAGLSHFPDPVTDAIDQERRELFQSLGTMYEGYFVITATYFPPVIAEQKFVELMFDDDRERPNNKQRTADLVERFKREITTFESRLSSAVKLTRLRAHKVENEDGSTVTHDDFLRWLQFCITGKNQPVVLPSNPMYLDSIIGGVEMWTGVIPRIGNKFVQTVAIEGFPMESTPGILSALGELPIEYRWSTRFIFMDLHEAVKHLEDFRKKWRQKVRGFFDQVFQTNSGKIDQDALSMVADADNALEEVNSGLIAQGYYTGVVVLTDESRDKVEQAARQLEKAINALGFAARIETVNNLARIIHQRWSEGLAGVV